MIYDIWYMIYDIWYMIYDIRNMYKIYDIWNMVYGIWNMIYVHDMIYISSLLDFPASPLFTFPLILPPPYLLYTLTKPVGNFGFGFLSMPSRSGLRNAPHIRGYWGRGYPGTGNWPRFPRQHSLFFIRPLCLRWGLGYSSGRVGWAGE